MAKKSFFERLVGATEKSGEKFFEELPGIPKSKPIKKAHLPKDFEFILHLLYNNKTKDYLNLSQIINQTSLDNRC